MPQSNRRSAIQQLGMLAATAYAIPAQFSDAAQVSDDQRTPNVSHGVASGDVGRDTATIWSRADRPSRMIVEVANHEDFRNARRIVGPEVLESSDFTGKVVLRKLPMGKRVFYRVRFQDLDDRKRLGAGVVGQLLTASENETDVRFAWSGDTAGQGFGIDLARGGMKTFATMRDLHPDFFVHSGDVCYADGPISSEMMLDDGTIWKNIVTEETAKVAESLDEFRANFRYNLLDDSVRRFNSEIPVFAQWDDHETSNNWYPGEQFLDDARYTVKSASLLAARAKQAFFDYMPIRPNPVRRIHRKIERGPLLDLFFLDLRTFRGPNSANRQRKQNPRTRFFGRSQLAWLKQELAASRATWKFICSDMPIGLIVGDGDNFENGANGDGPALGRELEIAELLKSIKDQDVRNVVFITADVHHAASHHYDPVRARFTDFNPFWEFVSGPIHAGTFGPGKLDNTFGPDVRFNSLPPGMKQNRPPSDGLQFFGLVEIDHQTKAAKVSHLDREGKRLWTTSLSAS